MKNPKVETRSRDSNLGPHDCKADALPHDHGHHMFLSKGSYQEEKDILPENAIVCYVKHTNPYNKQKVTQSFLKAKCGYTRK